MNIRSKIILLTLLLGIIVYLSTAAVSYYLSIASVNEEKEKQLAGIQEQAARNIAAVFEQVEKLALILSENGDLLQEVARKGGDVLEEARRIEKIESSLFRMNPIITPIIDTIQLSERNGAVYVSANPYFLTTEDWQAINFYRIPQLTKALVGRNEAWLPPLDFSNISQNRMSGSKLSDLEIVYKDRFVYVKQISDDIVVSVMINYRKMQALIASDSIFNYELIPVTDEEAAAGEDGMSRFGLRVAASSHDAFAEQIKRQNRQMLIAAIVLLSIIVLLAARSFTARLMRPIAKIRRQIEDVKKLDSVAGILNYKAGRIRPLSFRVKIFVFLAVVYVAGASVLFVINYSYASRLIQYNLEKYYGEYVYQSGNWIEAMLRSSEQVLNTIVSDNKLQQYFTSAANYEEMHNEFKKSFSYHHVLSKNINYINLYDSRGELLFSTVNSFLNEGPIQTRNVYPALQQTSGETIYFNENRDPFGDHVIVAAKKIYDLGSTPRIIGYYMFAVNERELELFNNSFGLNSLDFLIADADGTTVYSKKKELIGKQWPGYWSLAAAGQAVTRQTVDGREAVVMHEMMNKTNWTIVSMIDPAETFRGAKDVLLVNGYALLIILLLLMTIIYFMAKRIAQPIQELNRHIRVVIDNKFKKTTVPVFAEKDEIGELAAHIRAMIQKIQDQMNHIYDVEVRHREIQLEYKKVELSRLLEQISPHFLYNTLETIRWMSMEMTNGENKVTKIIRALSVYLRSGVHAGTRSVTVKEELDHVQAYLYIQQVRLGGKLKVKWVIDEQLQHVTMERFVLQPIVENALMHGIEGKESQAYLLIRTKTEAGELIIDVFDNGVGIEPARLQEIHEQMKKDKGGGSVGLRNISRRLALLYGEQASLSISSEPGRWTRVRLAIPLDIAAPKG
ncbi:sensor histidine kinase [Paenibacillus sp. GCM10027626]|uniref:sensor histidine kinase n=1 Tax=Paenibacillus sp. GCM10027626 TaxID=3273411 RepID=UPI00363CD41D